jgi:hypothetical protein
MDPLTQMRNGITNAREWFGWLNDPDLSLGWAAEDVRGYFDAFGQPRTVAMPMVMFQPLRGKYVDCASEAPGVSAVASLDGKRLASVALNDRPETRQIEFQLKAPAGTTFTRLDARMVWHDFKANRTRYARFNPTTMRGADGLIAKATLPAFALCTLEATLATAASPTHTSAQWRHPGDRVVFWLEPGKTEKASVKLPHEALTGKNRRYVLRLGYEHAGSDAALVTLNGKRHFVLPPQMRTSGWDLTELAEFMVDGADLRDTNEVVFTVAPGKERFFVDMVSIVVQDQAPASPAAKSSAISLDPASPDCTISEEPCRTLPDWYVKRYEAAPSALPPILAHWTFDDEKPGVIADRSGHGHDGTLTNGATLAEGMNGQALQLYGKHAGVRVADSPDFHIGEHQSYSIALWLKLQTPGKGLLLHKGAGDRFNVSIMDPSCGGTFPYPLIEGELFSGRTSTGGQAHATTDMSDGRWHHVVIVRDASEEALMAYVDGKYEGSATGLIYAGLEDLNPLFLGSDGAGTNCIHGLLDDVVFYGGALTPKQVADLFANHGVPEGVK